MKSRLIGFGIILMILICTLCGNVQSVQAKEVKNLDLVMVLDQSGSMKTNDPNGMMREAAATLASMMPVNISRVGVISFNREQTKVVDLTGFSSPDAVQDIRNSISGIKYKGDTDIGNAVADAVDMFNFGDGREHAILVLSDGKNDFGGDRKAEVDSDERLNDALAKARNKGCKIYALGFGPELQDKNGVAYKKLQSIATSEQTISTESDPVKIKEFFNLMLADLTDVNIPTIYGNRIVIEPNVKEANIYVSSAENLSNVTIGLDDPDGNPVPLESSDKSWFFKGEYVAVIKLFTPLAGTYTVTSSSDAVNITVGYIPSYEYILESEIVDENDRPVTQVDNGTTAEIRTVICQDNKDVTDSEIYKNTQAKAVITAKDTGDTEDVSLNFSNNKLRGSVHFTRPALYTIDISVESESFNLKDKIDIKADKREITIRKDPNGEPLQIEKKTIDKTFKKSADLLVSNNELNAIIDDPDQVGFNLESVVSSDEDKVTAQIKDDGILLTGWKWGSSLITVTYRDTLGGTVTTSFKTSVIDKLLIALFAMIPVLIGIMIASIVLLILRQSRTVRGTFKITQISLRNLNVDDPMGMPSFSVNVEKEYNARNFIGRKKTLGTGVAKYVSDIYSADNDTTANRMLNNLFAKTDTEMRLALDEVKVVGTYLGLKGCILKLRKGTRVSLHDNNHFGQKAYFRMRGSERFAVYVMGSSNQELCVKGSFSIGRVPGKTGTVRKGTRQQTAGGRGNINLTPNPNPASGKKDSDDWDW